MKSFFFNKTNIKTNCNSKILYLVNFSKKSFNDYFISLHIAKNLLLTLLYLRLVSQTKDKIELYKNSYQNKKDPNTTK